MKKTTETMMEKRERRLSVVFFTDAQKTRSFSIRMSLVHGLLLAFVGLMTWSVGSFFMILHLNADERRVSDELKEALNLIFEYQTRYERVFDRAYPAHQEGGGQQPDESGLIVPPIPTPLVVAEGDSKYAQLGEKNTDVPPPTESLAQVEASYKEAGGVMFAERPLRVSRLSLEPEGLSMKGAFDVQNLKLEQRTEGELWILGQKEALDGSVTWVSDPQDISLDGTGKPDGQKAGIPFGIRRFKRQNFELKSSQEGVWKKFYVYYLLKGDKSHQMIQEALPLDSK